MDDCCCQPAGPPTLQLARAVSFVSVQVFHVHSDPGEPFFCARSHWRTAHVDAIDNLHCGVLGSEFCNASVPIFSIRTGSPDDPCPLAGEAVLRFAHSTLFPIQFSEGGIGGKMNSDCWDGSLTLSTPTSNDDLIAACLANLGLIDLNDVPFGRQRTVTNDAITGAPLVSETFIDTSPPLPDSCPSPFQHPLAASLAFRYGTLTDVRHCAQSKLRRVEIRTRFLTVSASRSRFSINSTWCKRTRGPVLVDPDFTTTRLSSPGICADTACQHFLAASGVIDVPEMNTSVHIGLCTTPPVQCNQTPIPFA